MVSDCITYSPDIRMTTICVSSVSSVSSVSGVSGRYFQRDIVLQYVRGYLAYKLSDIDIKEMMAERGCSIDNSKTR